MSEEAYSRSAEIYDTMYSKIVPYDEYTANLRTLLAKRVPDARTLLEMASGTGQFLVRLANHYDVVGCDTSPAMVAACRRTYPDIEVVEGDMSSIDLGRTFDAVVCLFSAIGYLLTEPDMARAIANFARHLNRGGALVVDGWLRFDVASDRHISADVYPGDGIVVSRGSSTRIDGRVTIMEMGHMVVSPEGVDFFTEEHRMAMYTVDEFAAACRAAGLIDFEIVEGWPGRDRFIASKPG